MADGTQHSYGYKENAGLVIQTKRKGGRRDEPTGEVSSLRIHMTGQMGDRIQSATANPAAAAAASSIKASRTDDEVKRPRRGRAHVAASVLSEAQTLGGYRPKTRVSREAFEEMLAFVSERFGDQPRGVLVEAANEALAMLKDTDTNANAVKMKRSLESVLNRLSDDELHRLVTIAGRINDFVLEETIPGGDMNGADGADALDEDHGVAVIIGDEDEEMGEKGSGDDSDDDDEAYAEGYEEGDNEGELDEEYGMTVQDEVFDDEDPAHEADGQQSAILSSRNESAMDTSGEGGTKQVKHEVDHTAIDVHSIDAYWLQRELAKLSTANDATVVQQLAVKVLAILGEKDKGVCETKLVGLLGHEEFSVLRMLVRNRKRVYYCTRLKQAQTDADRKTIEAEMQQDVDGGLAVFAELRRTKDAATWEQERTFAIEAKAAAAASAAEASGNKRTGGVVNDGVVTSTDDVEATDAKGARKDGIRELGAPVSQSVLRPKRTLDLERLAFQDSDHTMANKEFKVPDNLWRKTFKGYEEAVVAPLKHKPFGKDEHLVAISSLPKWAQSAFKGVKELNRVQSRVFPQSYGGEGNLLICAPTGAGKTNVALCTILREVRQYVIPQEEGAPEKEEQLDLAALRANLKIVYIAPMKALVQEVVANFGQRLGEQTAIGLKVRELSGDQQLSKAEIADTQIIVTTPEKWDVITRKAGDRTYTQLVRLIIIDEIHLLHNDRGAVLEAIVARTLRGEEETQARVRLVGISATLPNYRDVATFLRVKKDRDLFFFDNSFRPVPLQQHYIGLSEKKAFKRMQLANEICYEKVVGSSEGEADRVIVFVHSRKETYKTANALREMAMEKEQLDVFLPSDSGKKEVLQSESEDPRLGKELKELLPFGIAIHHAGMSRLERTLVENLFEQKYLKVLVSTATLAWGVNLPAHTVIIKGTQVYSSEKGGWTELSQLDLLQMLGRAGRPQHDTTGEGIIITTQGELRYYLSLLNEQLAVESQLIKALPDVLNAEIASGSVQNISDAAKWLRYTYLYVRMVGSPGTYGVTPEEVDADPMLLQRTVDLVHSASVVLDRSQLVRYDRKTGALQGTPLGRVAAWYYVSHKSMDVYNNNLKPELDDIELLRVFSLSSEFENLIVRDEEKIELKKLMERVPIPIKEGVEESTAKVNVLLQAYISRLGMAGFAMACDLVYVHQSAGRIMRALFEIALARGWAALAKKCLGFCKMVDYRIWASQSPLRQLQKHGAPGLDDRVLTKLERSAIPWERMYDLSPEDIGEQVGQPKLGRKIHRAIHCFPKLVVDARVQPVTRGTLRVELTLTPDFEFDPVLLGGPSHLFWLFVEDADGEKLLHSEAVVVKQATADRDILVSFTVPMGEPTPPQYFVHVISDRFLRAGTSVMLPFRGIILPDRFSAPTELLDLQPLRAKDTGIAALYAKPETHLFNAVQTQVHSALYQGDDNVLVAAPVGSGKFECGLFAIARAWEQDTDARIVWLCALPELADHTFALLAAHIPKAFPDLDDQGARPVIRLVGDSTADLAAVHDSRGGVLVTTPVAWDSLSRPWNKAKATKARREVAQVDLVIVDDLHLIGEPSPEVGPALEVVVSRFKFMAAQLQRRIRLVGLSACVANARDVGGWLGCTTKQVFNFDPSVRPDLLAVFVQGFEALGNGALQLTMAKPTYHALMMHGGPLDNAVISKSTVADVGSAIVFVTSRRQTRLTAIDLLAYASAEETPPSMLDSDANGLTKALTSMSFEEPRLAELLERGVGVYHESLSQRDRAQVLSLFQQGLLRVLVAHAASCWTLVALRANLVIVMGTTRYDGKEQRYVDLPMVEVQQMLGLARAKAVLLCHNKHKAYWKRFLFSPLPVESHLDHHLEDHFCSEVVNGTLENTQDAMDYLTWTFFYWRLTQNPIYYNLLGTSPTHINDHLSELVETTLGNLEHSRCITLEDEGAHVSPLNLGMIASYYYLRYQSIELFASSLRPGTRLRGVLSVLVNASEFEERAAVRLREERTLRSMAERLPLAPARGARFDSAPTKAFVLLQAHFSRLALATDMRADLIEILAQTPTLLRGVVDVIASHGWLAPAVAAMELSQMIVQAQWASDSVLLQIPHFTSETVKRCEAKGVKSIFDVMDLEDDVRDDLLKLDESRMANVAEFCNAYPNLDIGYELVRPDEPVSAGEPFAVWVTLERDDDEEEEEEEEEDEEDEKKGMAVAVRFPKPKTEGWWILVADSKSEVMLKIKWVTVRQAKSRTKLILPAPEEVGSHALRLMLVSDSYLGCDRECEMKVDVVATGEMDDE